MNKDIEYLTEFLKGKRFNQTVDLGCNGGLSSVVLAQHSHHVISVNKNIKKEFFAQIQDYENIFPVEAPFIFLSKNLPPTFVDFVHIDCQNFEVVRRAITHWLTCASEILIRRYDNYPRLIEDMKLKCKLKVLDGAILLYGTSS